jgi:hypothetical protein
MSELTKEYFDQIIQNLSTKGDMVAQTKELKAYAREQTEELARMVADGFVDIQHRLDVQRLIEAHERKFQKLEEALHIQL